MKYLIFIMTILFSTTVFSQTYDLDNFPNGTITVETLRANYTQAQIKNMLENADMSRNVKDRRELGFILNDPNTSEQLLICKNDATVLLFEYIKKLRQRIVTLEQRLQAAGIP